MNILTVLASDAEKVNNLFGLSLVFPVIAIFAVAVISFAKTKYNNLIGFISSGVVAAGSIIVLILDPCQETTASFAITLLLSIYILLYVLNDNKHGQKGTFIIREAKEQNYAIIFYRGNGKFVAKSKYIYKSIEDAEKAIDLIQNANEMFVKDDKIGLWTRVANYPRFEIIEKSGKFHFQLAYNESYSILQSDSFQTKEECLKYAKEAAKTIHTKDVFISSEMPIIHENPFIDPYLETEIVNKVITSEKPVVKEDKKETLNNQAKVEEVKKEESKPQEEAKAKEETKVNLEKSQEEIKKEEVKPQDEVKAKVVHQKIEQITEADENLEVVDDEEDDENKKEIVYIDGKQMYVTYRKSIFAKVTLAHEITKQYYVELTNFIAKYPQIKRRDSWEFTSYTKSKTTIIKLGVKGKTLFLYLGLPYEEFQKEIFYLKETKAKAHEKTPTVLCVKSERSLKYAKELIEEVMKRNGLEKDESLEDVEAIETYKAKGIDELIREGLIKYFFTEITDSNKESKEDDDKKEDSKEENK